MSAEYILFDNDEEDYNCFRYDLNGIKTENPIICIADLGLWDGRRQGYRVLSTNLQSVLKVTSGNYHYIKYWMDGYGNLRAELRHHDGTNYILFRELKRPEDSAVMQNFMNKIYNGECTKADISRCTKSLKKYLKKFYDLG